MRSVATSSGIFFNLGRENSLPPAPPGGGSSPHSRESAPVVPWLVDLHRNDWGLPDFIVATWALNTERERRRFRRRRPGGINAKTRRFRFTGQSKIDEFLEVVTSTWALSNRLGAGGNGLSHTKPTRTTAKGQPQTPKCGNLNSIVPSYNFSTV